MDFRTKRTRLIQAIENGTCDGICKHCKYSESDICESEYLADNLLAMEEDLLKEPEQEPIAEPIADEQENEHVFFSAEQVRKMTPKEVHENYSAIMESMHKW